MTKSATSQPKINISRRKVIKGATAATLAAIAAPISLRADAADRASYPALALFLAFTTNPDFINLPDSVIVSRLHVTQAAVTYVRGIATAAIKKNYADIRNDFAQLAVKAGYAGGHCPTTFETLGVIADLITP